MALHRNNDLSKINRMLIFYNLPLNIFWTILAIMPISLFIVFNPPDIKWLIFLSIIFILPVFLTNSFLDKLNFANTTKTYEKMGVLFIQKITQNGDIINKLMRKKFPSYKTLDYNKASIDKLLKQTYSFERYHIMMFVIFGLTFIFALSKGFFGWTIVISLSNLIYNIYPILLQHYIRLKLVPRR